MRKFVVISAFIVLGIFLFFAYRYSEVDNVKHTTIERRAVDFSLSTIQGDSIVKLSEILKEGKPVILNFWASWCIPCEEEITHLNRFYEDFKDSVVLIGINVWDTKSKAMEFMKKHSVKFPVLYARNSPITVDYGINGVPETVVIDTSMNIKFHFKGPITYEILVRSIQKVR